MMAISATKIKCIFEAPPIPIFITYYARNLKTYRGFILQGIIKEIIKKLRLLSFLRHKQ